MSIAHASVNLQKIINRIIKKDVPLIFFDRKLNIEGVSSVTINDYDGGYQATQQLISEGCQRIAHLSGDCTLEIYRDRFNGYKQALLDNGYEFNEKYVIQTRSQIEEGKDAVKKLLRLSPPPDAIFSSSDFVALGAIQELKLKGIKIPEEFCVAGFSNEPFTRFMEMPITSVEQFPLDMGRIAAKVFIEQVKDGGKVRFEQKVVLAPKLYIRKSSIRSKL
jgi:LacI family transcriptional regulator